MALSRPKHGFESRWGRHTSVGKTRAMAFHDPWPDVASPSADSFVWCERQAARRATRERCRAARTCSSAARATRNSAERERSIARRRRAGRAVAARRSARSRLALLSPSRSRTSAPHAARAARRPRSPPSAATLPFDREQLAFDRRAASGASRLEQPVPPRVPPSSTICRGEHSVASASSTARVAVRPSGSQAVRADASPACGARPAVEVGAPLGRVSDSSPRRHAPHSPHRARPGSRYFAWYRRAPDG